MRRRARATLVIITLLVYTTLFFLIPVNLSYTQSTEDNAVELPSNTTITSNLNVTASIITNNVINQSITTITETVTILTTTTRVLIHTTTFTTIVTIPTGISFNQAIIFVITIGIISIIVGYIIGYKASKSSVEETPTQLVRKKLR